MANDGQEASRKNASTPGAARARSAARRRADDDFPVVGVGASAGGLEAFAGLFSRLPNDCGMAFVLIQHLDPSHTSNMVDLLRRYTSMPVAEARDGMKLEPDHVYMIPPNHNMTTADRTLKLVEQVERPGISHVDLFFRSLAEDLKSRSICIVLSGTGTDGALGAKAVKAEMGMVMVQDPDTARYDGMPRAAVAAGVADFVLPVEEMAERLIQYVLHSYGRPARRRREDAQKAPDSLQKVFAVIRARTKRDFSQYKLATINRRIERRMNVNQLDRMDDYVQLLQTDREEVGALVKDFLISGDTGRPIGHVTSVLEGYDLSGDVARVLDTLVPTSREVRTTGGRWFSVRANPYRTTENAIAGAVVSFLDISQQKALLTCPPQTAPVYVLDWRTRREGEKWSREVSSRSRS